MGLANIFQDQAKIPYIGCFPLVSDTIIRKVLFMKVLIDGGSALNILFASALFELGISKEDLIPINSPLGGVILGKDCQPLGKITLPVQYGTIKMFHIEYISFLVADFDTAYHTILDCPTLTKFMAI